MLKDACIVLGKPFINEAWIAKYECLEYERLQTKETLMSHDVPERPWQKAGIDLFTYDSKDYIVTIDYR